MRLTDADAWRRVGDRLGRAVVLALALGLGLLAAQQCEASTVTVGQWPLSVTQTSGGFRMGSSSADAVDSTFSRLLQRAYIPNTTAPGALAVEDSMVLAGPAGDLPIVATEAVGVEGAAGAVAACVASVVCAAGVAAVGALAVGYHVYNSKQVPCPDGSGSTCSSKVAGDGQIDQDLGMPAPLADGVQWQGPNGPVPDPQTAVQQGYAQAIGASPDQIQVTNCSAQSSTIVNCHCAYIPTGGGTTCTARGVETQVPVCPDGSTNFDATTCSTPLEQHKAVTAAAVAALMAAAIKAAGTAPPGWTDAVQQAIQQGGMTTTGSVSTAGPEQQKGQPTVTQTTTSAGTTTTTSTPVYHYTYPDGDVVITDGSETVTTDPDGNTSTTTVTPPSGTSTGTGGGTGTGTGSSGSGSSDGQPQDPCAADPNRVECTDVGSAPTDAVPKSTVQAPTYSPEAVALPAACPAPVMVAGHLVSYQPTCDAAVQARPFILVGAAFATLMLILGAVKVM